MPDHERGLLIRIQNIVGPVHDRQVIFTVDQRLAETWHRQHRTDKRKLELLRRAYVEARYSDHYEITAEELEWLATRIRELQDLAELICRERL